MAYCWWKAGTLGAYQTSAGMVIVHDEPEEQPVTGRIALSARVSSLDQKSDLERQMQRLKDYAAAKGYTVAKEVTEIALGLGDSCPKFLKLLADTSIGTIIVFAQRPRNPLRMGLHHNSIGNAGTPDLSR